MRVGFEPKSLGKKIEKIPQKYVLIVMIVLVVAVLAGLYYFLMMPQLERKAKAAKEYAEVQMQLGRLKSIQRNIAKHRQEYTQMQELLQEVMRQLPESKDIPNLLRSVTSVTEETRLKVKQFEPKQIKHTDFYSELPFEMKFQGRFRNLAAFLDGVRKLERIISVTDFTVEAKGPPRNVVVEGSCSANAYVYLKTPVKKAPAQGAKKANVPPAKK
ncbi:MAG: type 4a pilus biogenesis protein PilO [Syntrophorhabdus sp.]|jgi:type IV pilus assembly protein PilO|nr:type 4a pilus biogenesis protein PilO [Syntrophorhabdus sp.]